MRQQRWCLCFFPIVTFFGCARLSSSRGGLFGLSRHRFKRRISPTYGMRSKGAVLGRHGYGLRCIFVLWPFESAMFTTAVVVCFAYLTAESDFSPCFSVFLLSSGSSWWVREALVQGEGLRITLLFFQAQMFPECACLSRNDGYIPRYALEWIHEHQPLIDLVPRPVSNHRFRGPGRTQTTCLPPTPASTCSCCRSTRTRRSSPGSLRRPSRSAKVSGSSSRHFG